MKTMCSLALVIALASASACAPKVNNPADVEGIKQLMDGYFKAANAKDSAALDAVLTDRTLLLEPHLKALVGRDAIGKMHQAFLDNFDTDAKGPATEVRVAGDLAVAYGRVRGDHHAEGRNARGRERHRALDGRARAAGRRLVEVGLGDRQQRPAAARHDRRRGGRAGAAADRARLRDGGEEP